MTTFCKIMLVHSLINKQCAIKIHSYLIKSMINGQTNIGFSIVNGDYWEGKLRPTKSDAIWLNKAKYQI